MAKRAKWRRRLPGEVDAGPAGRRREPRAADVVSNRAEDLAQGLLFAGANGREHGQRSRDQVSARYLDGAPGHAHYRRKDDVAAREANRASAPKFRLRRRLSFGTLSAPVAPVAPPVRCPRGRTAGKANSSSGRSATFAAKTDDTRKLERPIMTDDTRDQEANSESARDVSRRDFVAMSLAAGLAAVAGRHRRLNCRWSRPTSTSRLPTALRRRVHPSDDRFPSGRADLARRLRPAAGNARHGQAAGG